MNQERDYSKEFEMIAEQGLDDINFFREGLSYEYGAVLLKQTEGTENDIKMICEVTGLNKRTLDKMLYIRDYCKADNEEIEVML